jgi:chromosome segregation protein
LLRPGQRLVSREGDLWRWDGLKAAADAPTAAARRLSARNRLVETEGELASARARRDTERRAADAARGDAERADMTERSCRDTLKLARKRESDCRDALGKVEKALAQLTNRLATVTEAGTRVETAITETEARSAASAREIADLPAPTGLAERLAVARAEVQSDRARLTEARAALASVVRETDLRQRRREAIADRPAGRDRGKPAAVDRRDRWGREGPRRCRR